MKPAECLISQTIEKKTVWYVGIGHNKVVKPKLSFDSLSDSAQYLFHKLTINSLSLISINNKKLIGSSI